MSTPTRALRLAYARDWAGYRSARVSPQTGTLVAVLDGIAGGYDTAGGRWQTVCHEHGSICSHETRALAEAHAADPAGWCEPCQDGEPADPGCWDEIDAALAAARGAS